MKGRVLLIFGVVVMLGVVSFGVAVWRATPKYNITKAAFERVEVGWPESRVEELLGVPAGRYAHPDSRVGWFGTEVPAALTARPDGGWRVWFTDDGSIAVQFDGRGAVQDREFFPVTPPEAPIQAAFRRVRRLLGL